MTILVAVAADERRADVIGEAVRLGRALEEKLYVVHLSAENGATVETRNLLDALREELISRGVEFSVDIEQVDTSSTRSATALGQRLAALAAEEPITRVVVGHESKDVLERLFAGDVAFTLAEAASVPVTVVPDGTDSALEALDSDWHSA